MGGGRWPKVIFNEGMSERKKSWKKQNNKWMQKWNIYLNSCPTNSKELNNFVREKFRKGIWGKELGRKKKYYVQEFNPTCGLQQKNILELTFCGEQRFLLLN